MSELIEILGSKHCIQLLRLLIDRSGEELYQGEIIKESGISPNTAMKWLKFLAGQGVLAEHWKGGLKIYSLGISHPVVKQLKILINVASLYEIVKDFAEEGLEIYLFGSAARGEDMKESDIDLLIVGSIDNITLVELTGKIHDALDKKVNPVVKNPFEYSQMYSTDKVFYENVQRDRIRLI